MLMRGEDERSPTISDSFHKPEAIMAQSSYLIPFQYHFRNRVLAGVRHGKMRGGCA